MKATTLDPTIEPPRLVPNSKYARLIGVTSRTLFNYVERGILAPPTIINGRKFWDPQVLPKGDERRPDASARSAASPHLSHRSQPLWSHEGCLKDALRSKHLTKQQRQEQQRVYAYWWRLEREAAKSGQPIPKGSAARKKVGLTPGRPLNLKSLKAAGRDAT